MNMDEMIKYFGAAEKKVAEQPVQTTQQELFQQLYQVHEENHLNELERDKIQDRVIYLSGCAQLLMALKLTIKNKNHEIYRHLY